MQLPPLPQCIENESQDIEIESQGIETEMETWQSPGPQINLDLAEPKTAN